MNNKAVIEYMLENERKRYEYAKEVQKTLRWAILGVLCAIVAIVLGYMYFVVPVEEEMSYADNGSQVVAHTTVGGDNNNGR